MDKGNKEGNQGIVAGRGGRREKERREAESRQETKRKIQNGVRSRVVGLG